MLYGYFGIVGSGKTLGAVIQAYQAFRQGRTVYSTMPLNFEHVPVRDVEDFVPCREGFLLADELWIVADSRLSMSARNKLLSLILLRSRKLDLDIAYTEQHYTQVDVRVRANTHFFVSSQVFPMFSSLRDARAYREAGGEFTLDQTVWDGDGELVCRRRISHVEQFFNLYDTSADPYIYDMRGTARSLKEAVAEAEDVYEPE